MGAEGTLGYAIALSFLGDVALNQGEAELARSLYSESVVVLRKPELGDVNFVGYPIRRLGQLAWREGNYENAISFCAESLRLNHVVSDPRGVMCCVAGFAAIAIAQGQFERAAKLMAAVETQLSSMGIRLLYMDKIEYEHNLTLLRTQLDEKDCSNLWAKGRTMTFEQAIALALEES
jgi:hypothetical protein